MTASCTSKTFTWPSPFRSAGRGVAVGVAVWAGAVSVEEGVADGMRVGAAVELGVGEAVWVGDGLGEGLGVRLEVADGTGDTASVTVGERLAVAVNVKVGDGVTVAVGVIVPGVGDGPTVALTVGEEVGEEVGVAVGVGVGGGTYHTVSSVHSGPLITPPYLRTPWLGPPAAPEGSPMKIGRASCRERVYVLV